MLACSLGRGCGLQETVRACKLLQSGQQPAQDSERQLDDIMTYAGQVGGIVKQTVRCTMA